MEIQKLNKQWEKNMFPNRSMRNCEKMLKNQQKRQVRNEWIICRTDEDALPFRKFLNSDLEHVVDHFYTKDP